jgi:hypothetical protein|tara:strand:+ start:118 stop:525 length:408 start_codon:yes stop_codon:yes gene_type:complete
MSGQTVTSFNALQFTNDNKYAYAYSGAVIANTTLEVDLMEFSTNSEYLVGVAAFDYDNEENMRIRWRLYFNDVVVAFPTTRYQDTDVNPTNILELVVPPFTTVRFTAQEQVATTDDLFCRFTGKAHMMNRVQTNE